MNRHAGFSLLELLVALTLLAIIGAGLASAMRLGAETYTRAQMLGEGSETVAMRTQLRRLLARATAPNLLTPFPKEFRGTDRTLTFVTLASVGFARDAAGLRAEILSENGELVAVLEPFGDDGATLRSYRAVIAEEVSDIRFRYLRDDTWQDDWDDTAVLPILVSIEMGSGTTSNWPDFTVELIYAN